MIGMTDLIYRRKIMFKKMFGINSINNIDIDKVKSIILLCRSLGVLELTVGNVSIRLLPKVSSDLKPLINEVREPKVPTESTPIKPDDKDISLMEDAGQICADPSGFMRRVERGEFILDKDFGDGAGEEI